MNSTKLAVLTFCFGIGCVAHAQQTPKTRLQVNVAAGKDLFRQHCSVCHGLDAKGNGSLYDARSADKSVRVPPADLTLLSQRNTGKFPAARVRDAIYSKGPIPAHGTPDMPAWGDVFYSLKSDPKLLDSRVRNLTAYIESLQAAAK
jgi:mono/diheme cytochrome c family protein